MDNLVNRKALIALDGSEGAFEAVKYVTNFSPFRSSEIILFNVFNSIPETFWDFTKQPNVGARVRDVQIWELQNRRAIKDHMEEAKQVLIDAGFPENGIRVVIHERQEGIARDLLKEARNGYHAVVVGRKGASRLKDLVLGSVASRLLEKLAFAPLVVVGENLPSDRVLLAVDGSESSMEAVESLAALLNGSKMEITLLHVFRGDEETYSKMAQKKMSQVLAEAKDRLTRSGLEADRIDAQIVVGAASRAGTIIKKAREGGYGTIVVGRRGLSKIEEFFIGRVSNKVVQLARVGAVWVMS